MLRIALGDEAPSQATIYNWYKEFKRKATYLSDEFCEGRRMTAIGEVNIAAVRFLIEEDGRIT